MSCRKVSLLEYSLACIIRLVLMQSSFQRSIQDRVEIATPLNSWKKLQEGIHLLEYGIDPYTGNLFHETPLMLIFFQTLINVMGCSLKIFFIVVDIATTYLLFKTASKYVFLLKSQEESLKSGKTTTTGSKVKLSEINVNETPIFVAYAYLFNPYIVLNCAAQTTTGLSNFFHAALLYCLVSKQKYACVLIISLATLQSCYPILLLVPVSIQFYNIEKTKQSVVTVVLSFLLLMSALLLISHQITGSWLFLDSIYLFIMNVDDLTPNIGLFWYFFTEMFEHFRALFIAALQINATILYLIPLSLHLRKEPVFLTLILMALTAVFKSYPSLGDVGFYLALLPLWNHLFLFMQQLFVVGCMLIITSVLGPTVWHLWIYSGSANANFFFGVTLAFATAQIFLITDLLFANKKRKFALKYGWPEDTTKLSLSVVIRPYQCYRLSKPSPVNFTFYRLSQEIMEYVGGALAGVGAGFFTNPLDVIKTRLQLQGELQARGQHVVHYRNTLHAVYVIARNDGILALQKGLVPALSFQVFLNGIRLGTFGHMESMGLTRKPDGGVSVFRTIVVSATGGCIGSYIGSPLYLVKTHLQSKAVTQIAVGHQHHHTGVFSALTNIYRKEGIKGLWRGSVSSLPRIAVGSGVQLSAFSSAKEFLEDNKILRKEKSLINTLAASMMSGVLVAVFMTPFDVVQTRLYNQGVDANGRGLFYSSIPDCFIKMWRTEGILGFFKGIGPCYLRIGPHTVLCLLFFDLFNKLREE